MIGVSKSAQMVSCETFLSDNGRNASELHADEEQHERCEEQNTGDDQRDAGKNGTDLMLGSCFVIHCDLDGIGQLVSVCKGLADLGADNDGDDLKDQADTQAEYDGKDAEYQHLCCTAGILL